MAIKNLGLRSQQPTPKAVPKKPAGKGLVKVRNDRPPSHPTRGRKS